MLRGELDRANAGMVAMVSDARQKLKLDLQVRKNLFASPPKGSPKAPPTRFVYVEAIKYIVKTGINLESGNHLRDFWHTVVPISYFDYVVLDKNWSEAARQFVKAIRRRQRTIWEASVYSSVPEFLWHFENESTYRDPRVPRDRAWL